MLAFIAFLTGVLPAPFIYVSLDNMLPGVNAGTLSVYSILATLVFWTVVLLVYTGFSQASSEPESFDEERI